MAITSGLFNSINGDRRYDAKWFAQYFATFIGNGVFPNPSTGLQVTESANMRTVVKPGKGWINGYFIVNDSDYVLQHDVADGVLKRIDRVVMRLNYLSRQIEIAVKKGAPASTPVAPALQRDADVYELALADVFINNGATVISQASITDTRLNKALCGIVHGTVDQVDTTTIFNQYQSWFGEFTDDKQVEFEAWLDELKDILDGDVAANLANRISALERSLNEHKAETVSWQRFKLTEDNGWTKVPATPLSKLSDLTGSGVYYLTAAKMGALSDAPITGHDCYINVVQAWANTCIQEVIPNATSTHKRYWRVVRSTGAGEWQRYLTQTDYDTLFQFANDGKTRVANAVTAKGVPASPADTFTTLATKIGQISTGKKWATGISQNNGNTLTVTGLDFTPSSVYGRRVGAYDFYFAGGRVIGDFSFGFYRQNTTTNSVTPSFTTGAFSHTVAATAIASFDWQWYAYE